MFDWQVGDIVQTDAGSICRVNCVSERDIEITVLWLEKTYTFCWSVGDRYYLPFGYVSRVNEMTVLALVSNGEIDL